MSDAEISEQRLTGLKQDVFGLQVPVHHASCMRIVKGISHVAHDAHCHL